MGLFNALLGNASEVTVENVSKEFEPFLIDGETIEKAYKLVGTKVEYMSIPYSSIKKFSKESAGILDMDAELKIWLNHDNSPIIKQFGKGGNNINEVYKILSQHTLK